jgi:hypothetical protein
MKDLVDRDDPSWDETASLELKGGRVVTLPEHTVREAAELVRFAGEIDEPIGGEIAVEDIAYIGPAEERLTRYLARSFDSASQFSRRVARPAKTATC